MEIGNIFGWLGFLTIIFCLIALGFSQTILTLYILILALFWLFLDEIIWRKA